MHLLDRLNKPVIFAHRGASKYAPENTMAAFKLAQKLGAPAIELDTMLSADGIPVVIHDILVDRTTNGKGRVNQLSARDLSKLDAGSFFSKDFVGEPIPLLKDMFVQFKNDLLINVELKNYHAPFDQLNERIAEIVKDLDNLDSLIFSSFLPNNLLKIKKLLPSAKVALLVEDSWVGRMLAAGIFTFLSPQIIHPYKSYIDKAYLKKEHARGRWVNAWTVNDLGEARKMIELDIDGLITDDPEGMLTLIKSIH